MSRFERRVCWIGAAILLVWAALATDWNVEVPIGCEGKPVCVWLID